MSGSEPVERSAAGLEVATKAPGRANLIGEHTDYNEGFVLPIAIELSTQVVGLRDSLRISLTSAEGGGTIVVDPAQPEIPPHGWGRYVAAVATALKEAGWDLHGVDGAVTSDVPVGAGLSSSAALEVAVALAITSEQMPSAELAEVCRRAENDYVGVASGIMDQLTSAAARRDQACLIDCRTDSITYVPWPEGLKVLLVHSGVERNLASSAFNERVTECSRAALALDVATLRDATVADIDAAQGRVDPLLLARARHVVSENERTLAAADALAEGDAALLGQLFERSHLSYSRDFDASTPAIDRLVEIARATPGVMAARLTGGGWGGCTINLISSDADGTRIGRSLAEIYQRDTGKHPRWWLTAPAEGATRLL